MGGGVSRYGEDVTTELLCFTKTSHHYYHHYND